MGLPVVLSDLHVSQYLNKTGLRDRLSGRETFVAVPIKVGEETVGALAFFKEFKRESVEEGIKLAMILATMLGMLYKISQRVEQEKQEWEEEKRMLTEALSENFRIEGIVGNSPAIRHLAELVRKVAQTDITVLITGESGTGKSLIAKAIHFASPRKSKPIITINCSAIPESLLEGRALWI
jgi:Nif-specific regulatory protein